jgi:ubiquinone/menaquinone biosynthesis C-methylase UbiE
MDRPDVDPDHLAAALDDVAAVNRWLGGTRALLRRLPHALDALDGRDTHDPRDPRDTADRNGRSRTAIRVLDVGTGSGDLPLAVTEWARRHQRRLQITALDQHAGTLAAAARRTAGEPDIRLVRGDALRLPFDTGTFDLGLLSMTLHHMDGPDLVGSLAELGRVTRGGRILVGELERSIPAYLGARLLAATVWRSNPVTRHDGPLSVRRAFTPGELRELAREAGLGAARVRRHPVFRLVMVAEA